MGRVGERRGAKGRGRPWYQSARMGTQAAFAAGMALALVRVDFVLLLVFLGAALLTGAWFCGWLCPLGTAQEWLGRIGKRIVGRRLRIPPAVERFARPLRYALLGLSLIGIGWLAFASEPYQTFTDLLSGHTAYVAVASWIALGLFLALSLLVDRPFCRYFCVAVKVQKGAVVDITVTGHSEVGNRYFDRPIRLIPAEILKQQSTSVDVVSGASATSYGIMAAVEDALAKAAR